MQDLWQIEYSFLIPLLPLIGACVAGLFGARFLKQQSHWPIWLGVGGAAVISISLLFAMLGQSHHAEHADASTEHASSAPAAAEGAELHGMGRVRDAAEMNLSATKNYFSWISIGKFNANWGYFFDPLTGVMLCVVCGIGFFITVFAAGYMKGETGYFRFFAYLGLFIFMMTNLVMGENLIMLYLGWEGVGLCSYLLIGYYYEKPAAREAAKKAFLVNRVGDFGFGVGIMLCYLAYGTVSYFGDGVGTNTGLLELAVTSDHWGLKYIPFLLMLGAFGKSAQFPLYVWLPDAMEGPTPVSALIHAATMVTAGVYMIARCSTLFLGNDAAMWTITVVGTFTAIFAGSIALRQVDLKKVFAYSTVSQLGFMFVGVGVLAPVAGVFHLVTHAFFKALLFLGSGVVMHAMMGELDLRKMSGLKRQLPKTRILMLIGCLALAGFPLTSGFFSKDEIIHYAHEQSLLIYLVLTGTAFLTAYYTFRLYFRVFEGPEVIPPAPVGGDGHGSHDSHGAHDTHGKTDVDEHLATGAHQAAVAHDHGHGGHGDHDHHNHEPMIMILPLVVLAIGALFAGLLNLPTSPDNFGHKLGHFLGQSPSFSLGYMKAKQGFAGYVDPIPFGQPRTADDPYEFHIAPLIIGGAVAIAGILVAYLFHLKDRARAERMAAGMPGVTRALEAKYWVDEIYQAGIVEPLRSLGRAFFLIDRFVVDGVVWAIGFVPMLSGFALKLTTQRGYLQGYAAVMLLGIAVILMVIFLQLDLMNETFLLPLLLIIPTAGAAVCALLPNAKMARLWALAVSLATAAVAVVLAVQFDWRGGGRLIYGTPNDPMALLQVSTINFGFRLAADAVSMWLILLTVLLQPLAIAASFDSIKERQKEYYAWMLVLLTAMLGVFVARDLLLFYVFFELTLIPMFFIIGIWGGSQRREAAGKFFLFTFAGSVFTLAGVIYIGLRVDSFDLDRIMLVVRAVNVDGTPAMFSYGERFWLFLAFLAGFSVKVPLFPVHTWLPLAHTEAPTAGSVILAGVLLKLGTYGLYRLAIPIGLLTAGRNTPAFPGTLHVLGVLCLIGIVYGALVAWVQQDIKKLVAYSSVSHLGFCVLGLIALNDEGVGGSVLYMINHGLSTGALFLVIGMIYDRYHTRDIDQLSGLAKRMPVMAFFFILFTLSSIGLPGLNGFVSEFLTILGAFTSDHLGRTYGVIAATGIVLGAIYMLHMAARVIWGPLKTPDAGHHAGHGDSHHDPELVKRGANADIAADAPGAQQPDAMTRHDAPTARPPTPSAALHGGQLDHTYGDLNGREVAILMPLAILVVVLGLFPNLVLKTIEPSIQQQITRVETPKPPMRPGTPLVMGTD